MKQDKIDEALELLKEEITDKGYDVFSTHFEDVKTTKKGREGGYEIVIEDGELTDDQFFTLVDYVEIPDGFRDGCTIVAYTLNAAIKLVELIPVKKV